MEETIDGKFGNSGPGQWDQDGIQDHGRHQRKPTKPTSKASLVEDG